jgi:hypothetical protein
MKNIILLILGVLVLFSCSKTSDPYASSDPAPQVNFVQNGNLVTSLSDSVKLIGGTNTINLPITYLAGDTNTLKFTLSAVPDGSVKKNGHVISYTGTTPGVKTISVTATDSYKKTGSVTANLTFFKYLVPVAALTVSKSSVPNLQAVILNASGSVAPDQKFGGSLVSYTFSQVGGNEPPVTTANNTVTWMINQSGTYTFNLYVTNIDGVNSPTVTVQFTY